MNIRHFLPVNKQKDRKGLSSWLIWSKIWWTRNRSNENQLIGQESKDRINDKIVKRMQECRNQRNLKLLYTFPYFTLLRSFTDWIVMCHFTDLLNNVFISLTVCVMHIIWFNCLLMLSNGMCCAHKLLVVAVAPYVLNLYFEWLPKQSRSYFSCNNLQNRV